MANEQNLKPVQSKKEARARGKNGGIASGKVRREKKKFKETLELLLSMAMKNGADVSVEDIQSFADLNGKNITVQDAILIAQVEKAMTGDTKAAEYVRDTIGESPTMKLEADVTVPIFGGEDNLED